MNPEQSRRKFLKNSTYIGCGLLIPGLAHAANVHELSGAVHVNKKPATINSVIRAGDIVSTGHNGRISFSIDGDAFMLKAFTSLQVGEAEKSLINILRLFTGKLLGVFETGRRREIVTTTATIGIRGTACFLNVAPDSTYYCNCYGKTVLNAKNVHEEFEATHHNAHQLDFEGDKMMNMSVMQVLDHSDEELRQLEHYVGRVPAFDR